MPFLTHYTSTINGKTDVSITADAVTLGINYHLGNDAGHEIAGGLWRADALLLRVRIVMPPHAG